MSAKSVYLLSTLTAPQLYTTWAPGGGDLPRIEKQVFVDGGANVANKRLITPRGVCTEVTADDYEALQRDPHFNLHVENGFITVSNSPPKDADVAAAGQEGRSPDAPLVEEDFKPGEAPTHAVAKPGDDGKGVQTSVPQNPRRA